MVPLLRKKTKTRLDPENRWMLRRIRRPFVGFPPKSDIYAELAIFKGGSFYPLKHMIKLGDLYIYLRMGLTHQDSPII